MSDWFSIDKAGLASILERRGKAFAVFELIQNAWDSGADLVQVNIAPIDGQPFAWLEVTDNSPDGWADLSDAFTMFARSRRAADALKRGRFSLGEKLVLSLCRSAKLTTAKGSVIFDAAGRRGSREAIGRGTYFRGDIKITRAELLDVHAAIDRLIPPIRTQFNGVDLERPKELATFNAKLPTEVADGDGNLRRTIRAGFVEAFEAGDGERGEILELGIPICPADWPWRLNVLQKVPLGIERDSVTDVFRRALQVAATNALAITISDAEAAQPWAREAAGDARITRDALHWIVGKRHGERAVVAVPGDPIANASAEACGYNTIHGGDMSAAEWANVRKHELIPTSSAVFPTPRAEDIPQGEIACPFCGRPMRK